MTDWLSTSLLLLLSIIDACLGAAVVASAPSQTFDGVGGSGAWWPYDLYNYPQSVRDNLTQLLFSQSGLGISSYRWNVGGGGVGVTNSVRAPTTFYISPGEYDWNADPQGLYFLNAAAAAGVPHLTAFANSAPAQLTTNGANCGGQLISGQEGTFGQYLSDVVQHFREEGIPINWVSPINEPETSKSTCIQEGMAVDDAQRAPIVKALYNAMSAADLTNDVGILADETGWVWLGILNYPFWVSDVAGIVSVLVHHTYDFPSDLEYDLYKLAAEVAAPGTPTWMTEVCCTLGNADGSGSAYGAGFDPTIIGGLHFASLVMQSFTVANEPHYDFWTLVSSSLGCSPSQDPNCPTTPNAAGWQDGMIYYDPNYATTGNHQLYLTKLYWTYKHFGNFVKPGSVRHAVTSAPTYTLAVYTPSQIIIIAINPGSTPLTVSLYFQDGSNLTATETWRTSAIEDFASVDLPVFNSGVWTLTLSGLSLTSFLFDRNDT